MSLPRYEERRMGAARDYGIIRNTYRAGKALVKYGAGIGLAKYAGPKVSKKVKQVYRNKAETKRLKTQVRNIQKNIHSNTGYLTKKQRDVHHVENQINEQNMISINPVSVSTLEGALTSVPYFSGGVLGNINLTDDAFQRKVLFRSISSGLSIRNNRVTPCDVRVYVMRVKQDTSNTPTDLFTAGLTDQMDTPDLRHPMLYLSDVEMVKSLWTQEKCYKKRLNAGQEMKVSHSVKNVSYDTSLSDTHALSYQKGHKAFCFVIRLEGVPAHEDNISNNVGTNDSKLTIIQDTVMKVEYDSGSNGTKRIITVNNSNDLQPGGAVVAQTTKRIQNSAGTEGY